MESVGAYEKGVSSNCFWPSRMSTIYIMYIVVVVFCLFFKGLTAWVCFLFVVSLYVFVLGNGLQCSKIGGQDSLGGWD